jgi:hypothetical protein
MPASSPARPHPCHCPRAAARPAVGRPALLATLMEPSAGDAEAEAHAAGERFGVVAAAAVVVEHRQRGDGQHAQAL